MQKESPLKTVVYIVIGIAVADEIGKADWGLGFWPTWCIKIVAAAAAGLAFYYLSQWLSRKPGAKPEST